MLWKNTPEKWKWAYGEVELESQRTSTTESEIVESYWKFTVILPSHVLSMLIWAVYKWAIKL